QTQTRPVIGGFNSRALLLIRSVETMRSRRSDKTSWVQSLSPGQASWTGSKPSNHPRRALPAISDSLNHLIRASVALRTAITWLPHQSAISEGRSDVRARSCFLLVLATPGFALCFQSLADASTTCVAYRKTSRRAAGQKPKQPSFLSRA